MPTLINVPPPELVGPHDDLEHYEHLSAGWSKKESVGREDHSKIGQIVFDLLRAYAREHRCKLRQEWTVIGNGKKIISDVTLSYPFPKYITEDGYLIAPALLAVESRSKGQRLNALVEKCVEDHHAMGTRYCWILDTEERLAYECHASAGKEVIVQTLTLDDFQPALSILAGEVFERFNAEE